MFVCMINFRNNKYYSPMKTMLKSTLTLILFFVYFINQAQNNPFNFKYNQYKSQYQSSETEMMELLLMERELIYKQNEAFYNQLRTAIVKEINDTNDNNRAKIFSKYLTVLNKLKGEDYAIMGDVLNEIYERLNNELKQYKTNGLQEIPSCSDLMKYVRQKGNNFQSLSRLDLLNSSWLREVHAYKIDNTIVVIAKIYQDDLLNSEKDYVFCGISQTNWNKFYDRFVDTGLSFGEKFHKYIYNNKCNCD